MRPLTDNGPHRPHGIRAIVHPLGPFFRHLPLSLRRHILYLRHFGRWGDFRSPTRHSEKMQWRILNDRRPLLRWTADKIAQKEYARHTLHPAERFPNVKIPATYWAGSDIASLRELAANGRLPEAWVFKPNHSCGRVRLFGSTTSKQESPNWTELARLAREWGEFDEESRVLGHWAYGYARRGMIAEERIGDDERPHELKILCFGGRAHSIMVQDGIGTDDWTVAYYDAHFERMQSGWSLELPIDAQDIKEQLAPSLRNEIVRAAEALAAPFDFMRVDFYVHDQNIWVGELTPYSGGGLVVVSPKLDLERGTHWRLPDLDAADPLEGEWDKLLKGELRGSLNASI